MATPEELANQQFGKTVTPRDRAAFEAGIKLGALYHQVVGFPIRNDPAVLSALEKALEKSFGCQPYVQHITVRIDPLDQPRGTGHPYAYSELRGEMLRVELTVAYQGVQVVAGLQFVPDLQFPLMYVKEIQEGDRSFI
jgi:hypothetical protein